jgi:hypothetical protein
MLQLQVQCIETASEYGAKSARPDWIDGDDNDARFSEIVRDFCITEGWWHNHDIPSEATPDELVRVLGVRTGGWKPPTYAPPCRNWKNPVAVREWYRMARLLERVGIARRKSLSRRELATF